MKICEITIVVAVVVKFKFKKKIAIVIEKFILIAASINIIVATILVGVTGKINEKKNFVKILHHCFVMDFNY